MEKEGSVFSVCAIFLKENGVFPFSRYLVFFFVSRFAFYATNQPIDRPSMRMSTQACV